MKFIQVTDTHLFDNKEKTLHGINTYTMLNKVITHLSSAKCHMADGVIVTGDISQDCSSASYELAFSCFSTLGLPIYWIHGNHDNVDNALEVSKKYGAERLDTLQNEYWKIITIDTTDGNNDHGIVSPYDINRLQSFVQDDKYIALIMHHHAISVGTPLIDVCNIQNSETFISHVKDIRQIKIILCGHVHGEYYKKIDQLRMETCPATCFQWIKGTNKIEFDAISGYKILEFNEKNFNSKCIYIN